VVSVLRNVTDLGRARAELEDQYRKLRVAEAEARAERHRLELIIDSVADPILVTDGAGDIVLMNTPAERLFTVPALADEEIERHVRTNDAHFSSFVGSLFSSRSARHVGEVGLIDPETGEALPTEAISGKILSDAGELTAVVTILHDRREAIEKARLYEQVKRASEELEGKVRAATAELAKQNELLRRQAIAIEQASAAKSLFLANMSHEFRTPLNAVLGYTNMLLKGVSGRVEGAVERNLMRIDSNARHLLAIVNDILDISRIEAGRMPVHFDTFAVRDLVSEVVAELEPIIQSKSFEVNVDVSSRLREIRSDRHKVKQIVLNFLSNALKFTHKGSITIVGRTRRDELSIAVRDTGIGIAPEDQSKIFEDFQQADGSPTRAYGGAGLGLAICRRLADMIGGRITVESQLGVGSTFALHLPLRAVGQGRRSDARARRQT
jgi:signal transduction histidine kinase